MKTMPVYVVLSVGEIKAMLRKARKKNATEIRKRVAEGKSHDSCCTVFTSSVSMEQAHRSSEGNYQICSYELAYRK